MGNLAGIKFYLSGPVESSKDPLNWRNIITNKLIKYNSIVLNPLEKPIWMSNIDGQRQYNMRKQYSGPGLLESEITQNKEIRQYCLSLVRYCDIMITYLDNTFTVGTFEEIKNADGKPIFIISKDVPSMWLIDQLNLYGHRKTLYFHNSIDDFILKLDEIDNDHSDIDPYEWIFITKYKQTLCNN